MHVCAYIRVFSVPCMVHVHEYTVCVHIMSILPIFYGACIHVCMCMSVHIYASICGILYGALYEYICAYI